MIVCEKEYTVTINPDLVLIAYWSMEEGTGVYPKVDATGNGHNLSLRFTGNGTTQVAGKVDFGQQFSSGVSAPGLERTTVSPSFVEQSKGFTICAWGYFTGRSVTNTTRFLGLHSSGSGATPWNVGLGLTEVLGTSYISIFFLYPLDPNPSQSVTLTTPIPSLNQWHFVRAWWDPADGLIQLAVNESTFITASTPVFPIWTGTTLSVVLEVFKGTALPTMRMDEIGYWKGIFSAAEAAALYNGGAGQTYPNVPGI
jgi:hypothetical protein